MAQGRAALFFGRPLQAYRRLAARIGDGATVRPAARIGDGATVRCRVLSSFAELTPTLRCVPAAHHRTRTLLSSVRAVCACPPGPRRRWICRRSRPSLPLTSFPFADVALRHIRCLRRGMCAGAQHARHFQADECAKEPSHLGASRKTRLPSRHCGEFAVRATWVLLRDAVETDPASRRCALRPRDLSASSPACSSHPDWWILARCRVLFFEQDLLDVTKKEQDLSTVLVSAQFLQAQILTSLLFGDFIQ